MTTGHSKYAAKFGDTGPPGEMPPSPSVSASPEIVTFAVRFERISPFHETAAPSVKSPPVSERTATSSTVGAAPPTHADDADKSVTPDPTS